MSKRKVQDAASEDGSLGDGGSDHDIENDDLRELREIEAELAKYGPDMIGDEEDRERLDAMKEIERELLLTERWEEHDELSAKRDLLVKKLPPALLAKHRKQTASTTTTTKTTAAAGRKKQKTAVSSSASGAKKPSATTAKKERRKKRGSDDDDDDNESDSASGSSSSSSAEFSGSGGSESEGYKPRDRESGGGGRKGTRAAKKVEPDDMDDALDDVLFNSGFGDNTASQMDYETLETPSFEDLLPAQVMRSELEKWSNEIFFSKVVTGLFVRVPLGSDRHARTARYAIAEIADVKDGEPYAVRRDHWTAKWLQLDLFNSRPQFEIKYISNKPFTQDEFSNWMNEMKAHDVKPPKKSYLANRKNFREEANQFVYTEEDSNKVIAEKERLRQAARQHNTQQTHDSTSTSSLHILNAVELMRLREKLQVAQSDGDKNLTKELKEKLRAHETAVAERWAAAGIQNQKPTPLPSAPKRESQVHDPETKAYLHEKRRRERHESRAAEAAAKKEKDAAKKTGGRIYTRPIPALPGVLAAQQVVPQKPQEDASSAPKTGETAVEEATGMAMAKQCARVLEDSKTLKTAYTSFGFQLDVAPTSSKGAAVRLHSSSSNKATTPNSPPPGTKKLTLGQYFARHQ